MAYDIKRLPSEASVDHDHEASLHDIKISGITKSFYNNASGSPSGRYFDTAWKICVDHWAERVWEVDVI